MDIMFMEQHFLRSPLRLYSDMDAENNNAAGNLFSAAMVEKARAHLQLWGRAAAGPPYGSPTDIAMLSGYGGAPRVPLPAHLWGGQPPWSPALLGPPPPPPPPPTTPSSSSGSPSPRPVFPTTQHRYSPYTVVPKQQQQETLPARN